MQLVVIAIGKLKSEGLESACAEYIKRSRTLLPITREVTREVAGSWDRARRGGGPTVLLDERGEQVDTPALAAWLKRWRDDGVRRVSFMIGDAHGFSAQDRSDATKLLALSKLTLPHRLAQLVLIEQLYRAGSILAGHPYHHR